MHAVYSIETVSRNDPVPPQLSLGPVPVITCVELAIHIRQKLMKVVNFNHNEQSGLIRILGFWNFLANSDDKQAFCKHESAIYILSSSIPVITLNCQSTEAGSVVMSQNRAATI